MGTSAVREPTAQRNFCKYERSGWRWMVLFPYGLLLPLASSVIATIRILIYGLKGYLLQIWWNINTASEICYKCCTHVLTNDIKESLHLAVLVSLQRVITVCHGNTLDLCFKTCKVFYLNMLLIFKVLFQNNHIFVTRSTVKEINLYLKYSRF